MNRLLSPIGVPLVGTLVGLLIATASCRLVAAELDEDQSIRRFNPATRELDPVKPEEVRPGKIYSFASPHHGGRVWAFATAEGGFRRPLGPGSTEAPESFDLDASDARVRALIEEAAPGWLERSKTLNRPVLVRLSPDNTWSLLQRSSIRSHYDLATLRRWEWHGSREVAVGHSGGYQWQFDGRWYRPLGGWHHGSLAAACR